MGSIEKTSQNAKMKQSRGHGSRPVRVPVPSSCGNFFSYTFRLNLRQRSRERTTKYKAEGGEKHAKKKRIDG